MATRADGGNRQLEFAPGVVSTFTLGPASMVLHAGIPAWRSSRTECRTASVAGFMYITAGCALSMVATIFMVECSMTMPSCSRSRLRMASSARWTSEGPLCTHPSNSGLVSWVWFIPALDETAFFSSDTSATNTRTSQCD